MRFGLMLAAALVLAACGQNETGTGEVPEGTMPVRTPAAAGASETVPVTRPAIDYAALSGYGDDWFLSAGWPGEYPPGFAVLDADVRVPARARPNPGDPQDVTCLLPQYANYQLWNNARNEADDLEYFVATRKFPVTILEDTEIEFVGDNGLEKLPLQAGDQLTYLRYLGEGFTVMKFNDREFDINESELREISDIGAIDNEEDLWVRVSCLGGKQGWLMFDEVVDEPGVYPSPVFGYGEAHDIEPSEVDEVRAMMNVDGLGLDPTLQVIQPPEE